MLLEKKSEVTIAQQMILSETILHRASLAAYTHMLISPKQTHTHAYAQAVPMHALRDEEADEDRVLQPEWLVLVGICTHLGCVPMGEQYICIYMYMRLCWYAYTCCLKYIHKCCCPVTNASAADCVRTELQSMTAHVVDTKDMMM